MARTVEQAQADWDAVHAAKLALLKGDRVKEVAREGRRMVMADASLEDIDAALASIQREIDALTAAATTGARRRRALSVSFG